MMNNLEEMNEKKNRDYKGISLITVGILTIVVAIAGSTFAFFAVSATNNDTIKGSSAYTGTSAITLTVSDMTTSSVGTKTLIPQLDSAIKNAITGTDGSNCIDGNGNAICKVYEISVKNVSSTTFSLVGKFTLSGANMPHLKFQIIESSTQLSISTAQSRFTNSVGTLASDTTNAEIGPTVFINNVSFSQNDIKYFYVVIWISEIGDKQYDTGSFSGTVQVDGFSASGVTGITSTIRS